MSESIDLTIKKENIPLFLTNSCYLAVNQKGIVYGAATCDLRKVGPLMVIKVKTSSSALEMDPWQTAKATLTVDEAKKHSDAAHTYSLEIGYPSTKLPLKELEQYLVPPQRTNVFDILQEREAGTFITTGGKETLIHLIESSLPKIESKTISMKDEELIDIFFNCCQLPQSSWKNVNRALQVAIQNCRSSPLPGLISPLTYRSQ